MSKWFHARLSELDKLNNYEWHESVAIRAGSIAADAGNHCAKLGFPLLHERSLLFGAYADVESVKTFLATCIAAFAPPQAEMLDIKQAAQVIGYSVRGLRKLVAKRAISFAQNGPHAPIKFRRVWLDEFIEHGSLQTPDSKPRRAAKRLPVTSSNHGFDASLLD